MTLPHKGETYIWFERVFVQVLRVARDGTWADIKCTDAGHTWTKRQPLPFPSQDVRKVEVLR